MFMHFKHILKSERFLIGLILHWMVSEWSRKGAASQVLLQLHQWAQQAAVG
jgi:hypothetical protein